jgi:hypothetical protein
MLTRALVLTAFAAVLLTACDKKSTPTTPSTGNPGTTPPAVQAVPVVTAIEPNVISADGGTVVTVTGTDFVSVLNVTFGGKTALAMTLDSDTSVTATAPPGTPGSAAIAVVTSAGTSVANDASQFTWDDNTLLGISFPVPSIRAGTVVKGSVSVKYPGPPDGLVLPLFWKITPDVGAAVLYPQNAYVPAGSTVGSFEVTTLFSSSGKQVEVATAHGGATKVTNLAITP